MLSILSTNPSNCIKRARLRDMAKGTIKKFNDEEKESLLKVMRKVKTNSQSKFAILESPPN
jgi:hypothetical protein